MRLARSTISAVAGTPDSTSRHPSKKKRSHARTNAMPRRSLPARSTRSSSAIRSPVTIPTASARSARCATPVFRISPANVSSCSARARRPVRASSHLRQPAPRRHSGIALRKRLGASPATSERPSGARAIRYPTPSYPPSRRTHRSTTRRCDARSSRVRSSSMRITGHARRSPTASGAPFTTARRCSRTVPRLPSLFFERRVANDSRGANGIRARNYFGGEATRLPLDGRARSRVSS